MKSLNFTVKRIYTTGLVRGVSRVCAGSSMLVLMLSGMLFFSSTAVGCTMTNRTNAEKQLITQVLLKPAGGVILTKSKELHPDYIQYLQALLQPGRQLRYVRAMSLGVHVLEIEPGLERAAAVELTEKLSADTQVEYAEPNFPRYHR